MPPRKRCDRQNGNKTTTKNEAQARCHTQDKDIEYVFNNRKENQNTAKSQSNSKQPQHFPVRVAYRHALPSSRPSALLYAVCLLAFVYGGFPTTVPPALPSPLDAAYIACMTLPLLNVASFSCHLTMKRWTASRTPRYHLPALLACNLQNSAVCSSLR